MNNNNPLHILSSDGEGADSQISLESVRLTCSEQLENNEFYDIKEISSAEEENEQVLSRQEGDSKQLIDLIDRIPNPEKAIEVNESAGQMPVTSPPSTDIVAQEGKETVQQELSVHLPAPSKKKSTKKKTKKVKGKQSNRAGNLSNENIGKSTSSKENMRISSPTSLAHF